MNLLGIDFGEKILGLAYSQGQLAEGLSEINIKEEERLIKICRDLKITKIVLGLPEGRLKIKVLNFAKKLEKLSGLEIVLRDETLTSHNAEQILLKTGRSRKNRQKNEHSVAAALILQSYLNES